MWKVVDNIWNPLRQDFDQPIRISSGYRSKKLNRLVGGAKKSQHCKGEAIDLVSADNMYLLTCALKLDFDQLIIEDIKADTKPGAKQRGQILTMDKQYYIDKNGDQRYKCVYNTLKTKGQNK